MFALKRGHGKKVCIIVCAKDFIHLLHADGVTIILTKQMCAIYLSILVLSLAHTLFRCLRVFCLGKRHLIYLLRCFIQELNEHGVSEICCLARFDRFYDGGLAIKQGRHT